MGLNENHYPEDLSPIDDVPCNKLMFESSIAVPEVSKIFQLCVGDVLSVNLEMVDNVERIGLYHGEHYVGTISGIMQKKLEHCLQKGNSYIATVQSTLEGRVLVFILPVSALRQEATKQGSARDS